RSTSTWPFHASSKRSSALRSRSHSWGRSRSEPGEQSMNRSSAGRGASRPAVRHAAGRGRSRRYPSALVCYCTNAPDGGSDFPPADRVRSQADTSARRAYLPRGRVGLGRAVFNPEGSPMRRSFLVLLCLFVTLGPVAAAEEPIFAPGAKLKVEAAGGAGGEGPAWHPKLGVLTSGNGHIYQLTPRDRSLLFPQKTGTNRPL